MLNVILFWVSFYSECRFILSVILFWVSSYSESHFILNVILFWVSSYSESHFILSVTNKAFKSSVIILNVIIVSVVRLNVLAPCEEFTLI